MNFGRSIRGKEAVENGEAPASVVAGWIKNGCTAAWIAANCEPSSWHHCNVKRVADGAPTDFFESNGVMVRWLLANFAARHDDPVAARRLPGLFRRAKKWGVALGDAINLRRVDVDAEDLADLFASIPSPRTAKPQIEIESIGQVRLTKREYTRERGSYRPIEVEETVDGAAYKGNWLTWTHVLRTYPEQHFVEKKGRCKRDSIIELERIEA